MIKVPLGTVMRDLAPEGPRGRGRVGVRGCGAARNAGGGAKYTSHPTVTRTRAAELRGSRQGRVHAPLRAVSVLIRTAHAALTRIAPSSLAPSRPPPLLRRAAAHGQGAEPARPARVAGLDADRQDRGALDPAVARRAAGVPRGLSVSSLRARARRRIRTRPLFLGLNFSPGAPAAHAHPLFFLALQNSPNSASSCVVSPGILPAASTGLVSPPHGAPSTWWDRRAPGAWTPANQRAPAPALGLSCASGSGRARTSRRGARAHVAGSSRLLVPWALG
jgi:hypothetical protein